MIRLDTIARVRWGDPIIRIRRSSVRGHIRVTDRVNGERDDAAVSCADRAGGHKNDRRTNRGSESDAAEMAETLIMRPVVGHGSHDGSF